MGPIGSTRCGWPVLCAPIVPIGPIRLIGPISPTNLREPCGGAGPTLRHHRGKNSSAASTTCSAVIRVMQRWSVVQTGFWQGPQSTSTRSTRPFS